MHTPRTRLLASALINVLILSFLLTACGGTKKATSATGDQGVGAAQQGSPTAMQHQGTPIDWKAVDQAMGRPGTLQPGNVYRYTFPRSDLQVTVGGVPLKTAFAQGGHVEFLQMGTNDAMYMGDLVLTEDEVNPVLLKLEQGGVALAALHNHLLSDTPKLMYQHIMGQGDPVKIAEGIRAALALSKTPPPATGSAPAEDIGLDTKQLDQTLGYSGKANGAVYQFSVPRAEKIMDNGMEMPPAMGVATAINFQSTGNGKAAITGDFVLLASEVTPVSRTLRENGINVTAVHSHALTETPRLFYLHFFANDDAGKLVQGLRATLDKTNSVKPAK